MVGCGLESEGGKETDEASPFCSIDASSPGEEMPGGIISFLNLMVDERKQKGLTSFSD